MPARLDHDEFEERSFAQESPFVFAASPEAEREEPALGWGKPAETASESPYEVDPYADIRPALRPEHAALAPGEITLTLGRQPAVLALHHMLASPAPRQAVLAVLLGHAGRRSMRLSGSDVPVPVYLRLLSRLCHEVAEQMEAAPAQEAAGEAAQPFSGMEPLASRNVLGGAAELEMPPVTAEAPQCANTTYFISGFPEYAVTVDKLSTEQRKILQQVASEIAAGVGTDRPVVAVLVVGHADTALRKPPAERDAFERDISAQRAANALNLIMSEARRRGGAAGASDISGMQTRSMGVGSTQPAVIDPKTETEQRRNRRVEIMLTHCTLPPIPAPWTWREAALRGRSLLKPDTAARARILCVLNLLLDVADAKDWYYDFHKYRHVFFPPGTTEQQKKELVFRQMGHLKGNETLGGLGNRGDFGPPDKVRDDDFVKSLEKIDEVITRSMREFQFDAEAGGVGASEVIVRAWRHIQLSRTDPKSIYSCYASYRW